MGVKPDGYCRLRGPFTEDGAGGRPGAGSPSVERPLKVYFPVCLRVMRV